MNIISKIFCTLAIGLISVLNSEAQPNSTQIQFLDEGNIVNTYPKVDWLKGEPLTQFDKSKIYIIELWATWCVPCIAAMPHLNELNNKFKDKNVVFIAQDVMEDDKTKVEKFVHDNERNMNFRVAYGGYKGSEFDLRWVKAAGISSIPQTFVIQNNTLVWITRPGMLNDAVLQLLADDKFSIEAAEKLIYKN